MKNNHMKLGDFGLAKLLTDKNYYNSERVGTPLYFSP